MSYVEPEHAEHPENKDYIYMKSININIIFVFRDYMKSINFYLSFFICKPLAMSLLFIYCASLACFAS